MTLRTTFKSLVLPTAAVALACAALFAPPASAKSSHKTVRHHTAKRTHRVTSGRSHGTMSGHTGMTGAGTTGIPKTVPPPNGAGGSAAGGAL